MTDDARFEDAPPPRALRLRAADAEDLQVLAALAQDAVFPGTEMTWDRARRRFAILLNRFRWEDRKPRPERVQSVLVIEDAMHVSSDGVDPKDADAVYSLLTLAFEPGEDGTGRLLLTLAGDGAIAVEVETLDVLLSDVTRPYVAPSGRAPGHDV